jgi:hypothetical protein
MMRRVQVTVGSIIPTGMYDVHDRERLSAVLLRSGRSLGGQFWDLRPLNTVGSSNDWRTNGAGRGS